MENVDKVNESELVQKIMAMGFWETKASVSSVDGVYCVRVIVPVSNGTEGSRKYVPYGVISHNYQNAVEMVIAAIKPIAEKMKSERHAPY